MKLFSWGTNSHGQLGLGFESELVAVPTDVPLDPREIDVQGAQISGGGNHSIIRAKTGQVYGAGLDSSGQLCSKGDTSRFSPLISLVESMGTPIVSHACGWDFSLFLSSTGTVYGCGSNKFGQLGSSALSEKSALKEILFPDGLKKVAAVSAGLRHGAVITADTGSLHVFGSEKYLHSNPLGGKRNVVRVASGQHHVVALDEAGNLFALGANHYGQCGKDPSTLKTLSEPSSIEWNPDENGRICDIAAGWSHSILLTDAGHVYTFGRNTYGQLGRALGSLMTYDHGPQRVSQLEGITSIAAGSEHSMALDSRGKLWTWGWNEHGSCGNGDTTNQFLPVDISRQFPGRILSIGCGAGQCFAVVDPSITNS